MLAAETREEIAALVRSGFYDAERLLEIFCEEMYEPGELERDEVAAVIDVESARLAEERRSWPALTDCDRLTRAFAALNARGVIALENAGNTQSDGYDDCGQAYDEHPDRASVLGYCFYHGQDLERAVRGQGLHLAFGPVDPAEEATKGPVVGAIVRAELERAGLEVEWDGTFAQRIFVPGIVWRRR
jgi:hypothetical protein